MAESLTVNLEQWVRNSLGKGSSTIDIDWSSVNIIPSTPSYSGSMQFGNMERSEVMAEYENCTDIEQTYELKTKRKMHCECSFNLHTGFSRGSDYDVMMATPPDITKFGLPSLVVFKPNQPPNFDEAVTIQLATPVKVKPKCVVVASIGAREAVYKGSFSQDIKVRGKVVANLYEGSTYTGTREINIRELALRQSNLAEHVTISGPGKDSIVIHVGGICRFKFVTRQKITMKESARI